jgi:hypothetical protein
MEVVATPCTWLRIESLLAGFAGIDVAIFMVSQLLAASPYGLTRLQTLCRADERVVTHDSIVAPLERLGLVFLLLGMVRMHGSINHKDKGAAEVTLWSWVVELVFLGAQYEILHRWNRENAYFLATLAQAGILAAMLLVALMLRWSFLHYRRTFKLAGSGGGTPSASPTKLLVHIGWSSSSPTNSQRPRR